MLVLLCSVVLWRGAVVQTAPHSTYQRLTDVGFSHLGSTAVVTGTTILVWVLLAFASDLYAAGSVVATVGVVLVALAVAGGVSCVCRSSLAVGSYLYD